MEKREIIIVGAGPAGMAAAVRLCEMSFTDVLIIEKEAQPGGVLRQCIHPGFGLTKLGKNLTGPEYEAVYEEKLLQSGAALLPESTVLSVRSATESEQEKGGRLVVTAQTPEGERCWLAEAVILASGCRERSRGALEIPGTRPAGIYTAGTAQAVMNLHNGKIGSRIVIIGSGDIGLIMARRFTLEGSQVVCVVEKENCCGGLERNRIECLADFNIPLLTETVVREIRGKRRVEAVVVRSGAGQEQVIPCDTVILSVGLIPEDGMAEPEAEGLFYCGNALYVHDLVDDVTVCGENAALDAAGFLLASMKGRPFESDYGAENAARVRAERNTFVAERRRLRSEKGSEEEKYITCTMCPNGCSIDRETCTGGRCEKGAVYARAESGNPGRILTSSVRVRGTEDIISVRTEAPIPRRLLFAGMERINGLEAEPAVKIGDVLDPDFLGTGIPLIATKSYGK